MQFIVFPTLALLSPFLPSPAGLTMEGLFRVPGPAAYTEELRKAFEEGNMSVGHTCYIQCMCVCVL